MLKISELACLLDWTIYNPRFLLASFSSCFLTSLLCQGKWIIYHLRSPTTRDLFLIGVPVTGLLPGSAGMGPLSPTASVGAGT